MGEDVLSKFGKIRVFIPIEAKADRPRPAVSGKRAKSVAKRRPSRDDATGSSSLDKMLRSAVPIDEFDLSPRKVRQASAVEDTGGDLCLPGAQPVGDCASGAAALGGEKRFAHLIFKPTAEVGHKALLTSRKVISEEMAERRRLEKVALETMVPVDLSIAAAPAEEEEPSWWSGFSAPEIPDVNPQEILEFFMEVAIIKIMKMTCTGFVKVDLSIGQISSWCQADITENHLEDKKLVNKNIVKMDVPSPLPSSSATIFAAGFDTIIQTTALNVGEFVMSKGGAFTLEIPMLLTLCVEFEVAEVEEE